jgi:hypothetical protein
VRARARSPDQRQPDSLSHGLRLPDAIVRAVAASKERIFTELLRHGADIVVRDPADLLDDDVKG